ncbi:MAG: ribosomal L7Ae/L30e/S12e/Gadd45 family protein [Synergistes sp.]|nr:ribosomal L7Ae/L30e/S12e/Gadd45 family protein [Synergistes sp.]
MPLSELSQRARCAGINSVLRNAAKGEVLKIFLAADVDAKLKEKIILAAEECNIPVETAADSQQLGRACAVPRKTAVAAILKK